MSLVLCLVFFLLIFFVLLLKRDFHVQYFFGNLMICHKEKRERKVVVGEEEIGYQSEQGVCSIPFGVLYVVF